MSSSSSSRDIWDVSSSSPLSHIENQHFRLVESPKIGLSSVSESSKSFVVRNVIRFMRYCDQKVMIAGTSAVQFLQTLIICVSLTGSFKFSAVETGNITVIVLCALLQICQVVLDVFCIAHLINRIHETSLGVAWRYFIFMIVSFAGKYIFSYVALKDSFADGYSDLWGDQTMTMMEIVLLFVYFSTACQTGVGYGDIAPNKIFSMLIAVVQMGIGISFSVFIIAMTLSKFVDDAMPVAPTSTVQSVIARISHNDTIQYLRRRLRKYLLLTSILWQFLSISVLYFSAVDSSTAVSSDAAKTATTTICFILQAIQCVIILITSLKFVRKTRQVTLAFLAQSYVSVLLSFAGIYATLYTLLKPEEGSVAQLPFEFNKSEPPAFLEMYSKLLYFSCVTMTTTGFGLIKPQHWAPQLIVMIQMLISTLYQIVIFGIGMSRYFKDEEVSEKWSHFRRVSADFDDNDYASSNDAMIPSSDEARGNSTSGRISTGRISRHVPRKKNPFLIRSTSESKEDINAIAPSSERGLVEL